MTILKTIQTVATSDSLTGDEILIYLLVLAVFKITIEKALDLLGIVAPNKM